MSRALGYLREVMGWRPFALTWDELRPHRLPVEQGGNPPVQISGRTRPGLPVTCHQVDAHAGHLEAEALLSELGYYQLTAWHDPEGHVWVRWVRKVEPGVVSEFLALLAIDNARRW